MIVGDHTGSGDHRGTPEFSECRISQRRPSGVRSHDRGCVLFTPLQRRRGTAISGILFLNTLSPAIVAKKTQFLVKRDRTVPPVEGAVSFHTTRWTIVMKAARSQAHEEQTTVPRDRRGDSDDNVRKAATHWRQLAGHGSIMQFAVPARRDSRKTYIRNRLDGAVKTSRTLLKPAS